MKINPNHPERGQAMITATVFFLIVSMTMILGLSGPVFRNSRVSANLIESKQSFYLADAGLEDAIYRLVNSIPVSLSSEVLTIGDFSATTNIAMVGNEMSLRTDADWNNSIRSVESSLIAGDGSSFYYGVQSGAGGFVLGNNSQIVGNVFSNGNIVGGNGSSITGDALAVGTISSQISVGGNRQTGLPPEEFPIPEEMILGWKDGALGVISTGNILLSGSNNSLGPRKIEGNLTLDNTTNLIVTGTLWITGNLTVGNSSNISLSSSYGNRGGVIVVDGTISLGNSAILSGSGMDDSNLLLISLAESSAVNLGNGASVDVLYAPNGNVTLGNNADIEVVVADRVTLANNTVLVYEQGLIHAVFTGGPSGSWVIDDWREVR